MGWPWFRGFALVRRSVLRRRVADLVDLVATPADGGQDDQEADRGDDRAQHVTAVDVIGIGARGLHPAARRGQCAQPDGEQRGQAGAGEQAEHHDLPESGEIDPGHLWFPVAQAAAAGSDSAGATPPDHSSFTLLWSTLVARDLK